jgi:hypothetical protein
MHTVNVYASTHTAAAVANLPAGFAWTPAMSVRPSVDRSGLVEFYTALGAMGVQFCIEGDEYAADGNAIVSELVDATDPRLVDDSMEADMLLGDTWYRARDVYSAMWSRSLRRR